MPAIVLVGLVSMMATKGKIILVFQNLEGKTQTKTFPGETFAAILDYLMSSDPQDQIYGLRLLGFWQDGQGERWLTLLDDTTIANIGGLGHGAVMHMLLLLKPTAEFAQGLMVHLQAGQIYVVPNVWLNT